MPNSILSNMSPAHRWSFAQLRDLGIFCNGINPVYAYSLRNGAKFEPGMAAPSAAPVVSPAAGPGLTGTFACRVRYWDSLTGTLSLPSAIAFVALADEKAALDISALTPPARATHWIIERTSDGGGTFFPVNKTFAQPDGTPIATATYEDELSDDELSARDTLDASQARAPQMQFVFANQNRIFGGGLPRFEVECTVANGSANVSSAAGGFLANMAGLDFSVKGDTSGKTYKIQTVSDPNNLVLAENFDGTGATAACYITGARDCLYFSEDGNAEYWGSQEFTGTVSNSIRIGDDGEPLTGGAGLGPSGVIVCKQSRAFLLSYTISPHPYQGDARLIQLPVRRGVVNDLAIKYSNGFVYGIDHHGIWRMAPGGSIEEIGSPIAYDWWKNALNWSTAKNWWIRWQPVGRLLLFGVTFGAETYPQSAFVWSQDEQKWLGTRKYCLGVTCGCEMPDADSRLRSVFFTEAPAEGVKSYAWFDHIGKSAGADPGTVPLTGTIGAVLDAHPENVAMSVSGAVWPVATPERLLGVPFKLVRALDGSEEIFFPYETNHAYVVVKKAQFSGAQPVAGDTLQIGPINAAVLSARLDCGFPDRKKKFRALWLWLKKKSACVSLKVKVFIDGKAVTNEPDTDFRALNEDGNAQAAGAPARTLDPTVDMRHEVPLNNLIGTDIQFQFYSSEAGAPWEISKCKLVYEVEGAVEPRK